MSERIYQGGAHRVDYLAGDTYPSNFNFRDPLLDVDLYALWNRSEFVQLVIDWMPFEAFRRWLNFINDEGPVAGFKFGQPYTFEGYEYTDPQTQVETIMTGFDEYCQWNNIKNEWIYGVSMSRLYPEGALLVFLDDVKSLIPITDKDGSVKFPWPANPKPQGYYSFRAYQPIQVGLGTGFRVGKCNPDGSVKTWELQIQSETMTKAKTFEIDAERCIHLIWKKRANGWCGTSRVTGMARVTQLEGQIFEKLTKRAHDIAGGILEVTGVSSEAEQAKIDSDMGSDLTSVDRIYLQEGRTVEYKTPDLKAAGEFSTIFEMFTKKLCRHMRVSQLILDGEHTGAGLGGNNNVELMNSYSEIYQIQEHYRNDLEKVFWKLGKTDTRFIYNEILPEDLTVQNEEQARDGSNIDSETDESSTSKKDMNKQSTDNK